MLFGVAVSEEVQPPEAAVTSRLVFGKSLTLCEF